MLTHRVLSQGEVNDLYLQYLLEFNKKTAFVETQKLQTGEDIKSIRDVEPTIEHLRVQVILA